MYKVVIADDEMHICRLIQALVDWESMNMEVVGVASNGLEAIELSKKLRPEILITDIRMPGCDGLTLIKAVKESIPEIEIIIISGHAYFSYAQTAMQCNVGDYLLKPINKIELNQTLQKLHQKIELRLESQQDVQNLINKNQLAKQKMKSNLIYSLLENKIVGLSLEMLREEYALPLEDEVYQGFCIKLDYDLDQASEIAMNVVYEKMRDILKANIGTICTDYLFTIQDSTGYGIVFYDVQKQTDIKRRLRDCLNQFIIQKSILGSIEFTMGISSTTKKYDEMHENLLQSELYAKERVITSTERLIENMSCEASGIDNNILDKYIRLIIQAIDVYSKKEASEVALDLKQTIINMRNVRGYEVIELVLSAGSMLLMQVNYKNQKEAYDKFYKKCNACGSINKLFEQLINLQDEIIEELHSERENEVLRPIRMAKQYILNHFNEQITLEEVSDIVGLSSSYFSALFKKEMGEGFAKYLISVRIDEAKRLLRESNLSIAAICKTVGYNDVKHFTHIFEKTTGLKPSTFRKLYG